MSTLVSASIGIPVYNGEDFIRQAIESVLNQSFANIELVISDNCSTDNTQSICEEYAIEYPQIRYFRQSVNQGMIANFNNCLGLAKGDFFCWLSHDDFLSPSYISECIDMLDRHPQAIACCSEINFVNYDGTNREGWTKAYRNFDALNKNVVERVRELTSKVGWYALYSLFRIDTIRNVGTCKSRYADDVLLMLDWLLLGEIAKVPEHLYNYRIPDIHKTPEDYIKAFGLDSDTSAEVRKGSFTYTAKQILNTVYASNISMQDKHRIKSDFIKTLTYNNQDWLNRIAQEQNWIGKNLTTVNIQELLESIIISDNVAKEIEQQPPLTPTKALVFFPHNPYPVCTGAHRRCLEMLSGLRNLGCEIVLFSSNLYTDQVWTQQSIDFLKVKYGIDTFIYQATENDIRYLESCRTKSPPDRINWEYFNAPGLMDSFKQIFRQFQPTLVFVSYSLWGRLVSGKEFDAVVKVIDTIDLISLTLQMFAVATPYFSQPSIDPATIVMDVTDEDFFRNLNLRPEQEEYDICDLYDYTIGISQKENYLLTDHTHQTENLYVPMSVEIPQIINTYNNLPLFVISGNCFNLQGATYFIKKVLPLITESIPNFKLRIVGTGSNRLIATPELDICGFVEDLSPLYTQSGFAICPLIGGTGQQVKIVEAMAHGLPVVGLINVAETSPIEHGISGFIAHNAEEFARYTILLWNDRNLCKQMGEAARKTMTARCSSSSVATELREIVSIANRVEWKNPHPQIAIDGVFFQLYRTGIARVWKSLLEEWANTEFGNHLVVLDRVGTAPKIEGISYYQIPAYDYNNTDADREMLQQVCDEIGAELFISTYYTTPLETPSVFMGYDMIPEVVGADLNQPMWQEKQRGIAHASAFLTISEHTAKDLLKYYPEIDPATVTPALCGVQPVFKPAQPSDIEKWSTSLGITKPYFLLVGAGGGYKNTILFWQGFAQLANNGDFDIVCTGAAGIGAEEYSTYAPGSQVHCLQLDDRSLNLAYAGAIALIYPSKYEGFGLPIVEALASGCPVITCHNASIPEVAGTSAIYIDDTSIEEMTQALINIQQPEIRDPLIAQGLIQSQKFSWGKMAGIVQSVLLDRTLAHLQLNSKNLIIFPDWSADEEELGEELSQIFERLAQDSDLERMTLLIDTSNCVDPEVASMLVSTVAMNIMMSADIDITEQFEIAFTGELAPIQWQALLPKLQGRIKLDLEDVRSIQSSGANLISEIQLTEPPALTLV